LILSKIIVNLRNSDIIIVLFRIKKKIASLKNKIAKFNTRFNIISYKIVYFRTIIKYIIKATRVNIDDILKLINYKEEL
jgi:hypothetical protein